MDEDTKAALAAQQRLIDNLAQQLEQLKDATARSFERLVPRVNAVEHFADRTSAGAAPQAPAPVAEDGDCGACGAAVGTPHARQCPRARV